MSIIKELLNKRNFLENQAISIRNELGAAKARRVTTGEYADAKWFQSERAKLRTLTMQTEQLNRELKAIQLSELNKDNQLFRKAASIKLTKAEFEEIERMARDMAKKVSS